MNQARLSHLLQPNEAFTSWLADLGLGVEHSTRGQLKLDDVFVYPDLQKIVFPIRKNTNPPLNSEHLISELAKVHTIHLTGAEKSGKTSSCKRLFVDSLADNLVPVYLNGGQLSFKSENHALQHIFDTFGEQYSPDRTEKYRQTVASQRPIIVDDIHKAKGIGDPFAY